MLHDFIAQVSSSRLLSRALTGLAVAHCVMHIALFFPRNWDRTDRDRDVVNYYIGAQRAARGLELYDVPTNFTPQQTHFHYIYLPPFAAVISPAASLDFLTFARSWSVMLWLCFWGYAWCLARLAIGRCPTLRHILIAGLAIGIIPGSIRALALGQIDPLLWLLLGASLLTRWGVLLAIASVIKMFFAWPLLVQVRYGSRVLLPVMAALSVLFSAGYFVCGFDSYTQWLVEVAPVLGQGTFNPDNYSISMAMLRVAQWLGWEGGNAPLTSLPRFWLAASSMLAPAAAWWLARRQSPQQQCAIVAVAAILFSPTCWSAYLPVVLAPLAIYFNQIRTQLHSDTTLVISCDEARPYAAG